MIQCVWRCRRIENWNDARWNAEQLPQGVARWTKDRIINLQGHNDPELEGLITTLTSSLCNPSNPPALQCNLLAFLETLAAHDSSAQALVNSPLTPSLVNLLEHEGDMLRMRAATVLGILIRFATTIEVDLLLPGGNSHFTYLCIIILIPHAEDYGLQTQVAPTGSSKFWIARGSEARIEQHVACPLLFFH